jgi:PIN domain nuclease of toxin-antitoxin system
MRLLLDTCVFLWLIWDARELPEQVREVIADPEHELWLSSISIWEACQKHRLGKLKLHAPEGAWAHFVTQRDAHGVQGLPFNERDVQHLAHLPILHRDPFDRMLICQAIERGLTLVSPDPVIRRYPLRTLWS